jgi:ABC-type Fe3+/spermidine/putrescine transport system ATPase subunit
MADGQEAAGPGEPTALRLSHLSKSFPGTRALDDVSFDVRSGEFHALVGGNGSGKSTLIKILAGVYHGEPGGVISVDGADTPAERTSPDTARAAGLHFVHQNPAVFPALSVAENLSVGRGTEAPFELVGAPWIDGYRLASYLNNRRIPGVRFVAVDFTPAAGTYRGSVCHGIRVVLIATSSSRPRWGSNS